MLHSFIMSFTNIRKAFLLLAVLLVAGCGSLEDRAQSYYERGMRLLAQQDYAKAGIEFRNALQLKKDLVGAWRGLAQIEERNQNWEPLAAVLRTIVDLDPTDVESRVKLARFMLAGNVLDQALNLSNAAVELDNHNASAHALKAAVLLKLNDSIGATREAQAALKLDPANAEALIVLAAERLAQGDAGGALLILDRQAVESDVAIQLFKAKLFNQLGDLKQLEVVLRKLVELYPRESTFRRQLIKFYVGQKRPDDAENELRILAAADPTDVEAGLDLVRFLQQVKGPAVARQELVTRIDAGGQNFRYKLALAEFDFSHGAVTDGIRLLENLASSADSREQALAAQVKLAELHLSRKNFDVANVLVTEVLRKDSRNIDGLRLRAALRMVDGQVEAAIADIRQALNDQPRSSELMLLLATAYERSGSIELAERQYADAATAAGFDPTVSLSYVSFLRRRGNIERAEDFLTALLTRRPDNLGILSTLADVRLRRQNWAGAQEIANRIRRLSDERDQGLADQILAAALSGEEKYDDSIRILVSAQAGAPAAVEPMVALVGTLMRAQKLDRATAFLKTVLQANDKNAEAYVLLGSIQFQKNAPELALQSFRAAIEQQPKNMAGYQALANFHLREKNYDEALKVIRVGVEQQPDSFTMRLALASALELKGDYEAAISEYEYMFKQNSGSLIVMNNLASLLSTRRTDKDSLERAYSLATTLRKSPIPAFKDTLGWAYLQRGDYKSAVPLLEQAAVELPNNPVVRYHLGMSYIAMGQVAQAGEELKKARELAPDNDDLQAKIKAAQEKVAM